MVWVQFDITILAVFNTSSLLVLVWLDWRVCFFSCLVGLCSEKVKTKQSKKVSKQRENIYTSWKVHHSLPSIICMVYPLGVMTRWRRLWTNSTQKDPGPQWSICFTRKCRSIIMSQKHPEVTAWHHERALQIVDEWLFTLEDINKKLTFTVREEARPSARNQINKQ